MKKRALFAALTLLATSAGAADLTKAILDLDGKPVPSTCVQRVDATTGAAKMECSGELTYQAAILVALLNAPDQAPGSGQPAKQLGKMQRFLLADKIQRNPHFILGPAEMTLIEDSAEAYWPSPLIVGRILQAVDPSKAVQK